MISILVCSINTNLLIALKKSLKTTNTLPLEVLVIDNLIEKKSISQAYNKLAKLAKYDNLVFVHEDVEFVSSDWYEKLICILKNKEVGIVGVAGSTYLPSVPSGWYLPNEYYNNVFIHQGFKYRQTPVRFDNQGKDLAPVYLLDGVSK